jgi:hypothetical protein
VPIHTIVTLRQLGFSCFLLVLATSSAAVVLSGAHVLAANKQRATASRCAQAPSGTSAASAYRVGVLFVRTAVLRHNEICSYELVTRELKQGLTREEWATGNIPIQAFPTREPQALRMEHATSIERARERTSVVLLEATDLGQAFFELVVVERKGRWLVGYWGPAASAAVLGSPAMP